MGKTAASFLQRPRHRGIVETLELRREDEALAPREIEDVLELADAKIGIDLVGDGADQLEREVHHRKIDAVRKLHGDDIASADPGAPQEFGTALDALLERAV